MVATANPHASQAGLEMLRGGGSALDAAIAAQLVLNLTEPQSSGIGGGAFILHWDEAARRVSAYDGRETAPAAARPERFLLSDGKPMSIGAAIDSGRSVGVPGLLRVMHLAHAKHGRLQWASLFGPAIRLAEDGFPVSPRLHALIKLDPILQRIPPAAPIFISRTATRCRLATGSKTRRSPPCCAESRSKGRMRSISDPWHATSSLRSPHTHARAI